MLHILWKKDKNVHVPDVPILAYENLGKEEH